MEVSSHSEKIGVWATISCKRVTGPIFYKVHRYCTLPWNDWTVCSVTWARREILLVSTRQCHSPHLKRNQNIFDTFFPTRLISRGLCPPRSPDLSPLNYFMRGFIKDKAYANKPTTIEALKTTLQISSVIFNQKHWKSVAEFKMPRNFPYREWKWTIRTHFVTCYCMTTQIYYFQNF